MLSMGEIFFNLHQWPVTSVDAEPTDSGDRLCIHSQAHELGSQRLLLLGVKQDEQGAEPPSGRGVLSCAGLAGPPEACECPHCTDEEGLGGASPWDSVAPAFPVSRLFCLWLPLVARDGMASYPLLWENFRTF